MVDAAERAGAVENDPRALTVLAYAAPIECGSVVTKWLDSAPSSAETNAELARGYGSAAVVIGSFELAPRFLATAVDGLRSQGRLGNLARLLVIQSWDATCLGEWARRPLHGRRSGAVSSRNFGASLGRRCASHHVKRLRGMSPEARANHREGGRHAHDHDQRRR